MNKKIIMGNNKLWKKTHVVLLNIFCHGASDSENSKIILGSLLSIIATPTTWPIIVFKRIIHLVIFLSVYFILSESLSQYENIKIFIVSLALLAIFYRDIYQQIAEIITYFFIIITAGGFLRWLCRGYLNNAPLRQQWAMSPELEPVIASLVPSLPAGHLAQYNKIMNLYLESNESGREQELNKLIDQYWNNNV